MTEDINGYALWQIEGLVEQLREETIDDVDEQRIRDVIVALFEILQKKESKDGQPISA